MDFVYSTGGRENYFSATNVGDCVTRAICNATGKDYLEVYKRLQTLEKTMRLGKYEKKGSVRDGTRRKVLKKYIEEELGWKWVPCMSIGTGCQVHICGDELPKTGSIILNLSKHLSCVKDGVLYDTYDCSRNGTRCVYGYWREPTSEEKRISEETKAQVQAFKDFQKSIQDEKREKINQVKLSHKSTISKLEKKLKEIKHQLTLEQNRQKREIAEIEESYKDCWAKKGVTD